MGLVDVSEGIAYLEQNGFRTMRFPRTRENHGRHDQVQREHEAPRGRRREVFRLLEDQEKAAAVIAAKLSDAKNTS